MAWRGPTVEVEGILSAKTGGCPEDCHFCSQSSQFDTPILATPFLDTAEDWEYKPEADLYVSQPSRSNRTCPPCCPPYRRARRAIG